MIKNEVKKNLIYNVAYKTPCGAKLLRIIFDKLDRYIRKYDSAKFLALLHSDGKDEIIFDRIQYLFVLKNNNAGVYSHKYMKIKLNSDDDLPLEKALI